MSEKACQCNNCEAVFRQPEFALSVICPSCNCQNISLIDWPTHEKPADYAPFYMEAFYRADKEKGSEYANKIIDSVLVTYTRDAMTTKLKRAAKQGNKNWWVKEWVSIDELKTLHAEHVAKGEFLDAAIFAMMTHARQCAEYLEQEAQS